MYIAVFMLSAKLNQFKDNPGTNRDTSWWWHRRTKCRRWLVMQAVRGLAGYQRGFRCQPSLRTFQYLCVCVYKLQFWMCLFVEWI